MFCKYKQFSVLTTEHGYGPTLAQLGKHTSNKFVVIKIVVINLLLEYVVVYVAGAVFFDDV